MSALARYFKAYNKDVYGYDKTRTSLTDELVKEGVHIIYKDDEKELPDFLVAKPIEENILIIYTPAIPDNNIIKNYFSTSGYNLYKRSEVLGMITEGSYTIAVAGTHGKTTTSCMIAHILKSSGRPCTAFMGGISSNYDTNILIDKESQDSTMVIEADEYDRSFLQLTPDIAVVTSIDADHLEIYGNHESMLDNYMLFAGKLKQNGILIYKQGLPFESSSATNITYSIEEKATIHTTSIRISDHKYVFDFNHEGAIHKDFVLTWPGRHNVENALAAIAVARFVGVGYDEIKNALQSFKGVRRRFDYRLKTEDLIYIDDYAHHPKELNATISSVKELYPGRTVLGVFQPHLYSRTRDFASEFAESLSQLDQVMLLDIYPAREEPIEGVTSRIILDKISHDLKAMITMDSIVSDLSNSNADIILTLGAGDIDSVVEDIEYALSKKNINQI